MDSLDIVLLVLAAALIPLAGLCAAADAAMTMVSPARVEELDREGRRGAAALLAITRDRPRYTNLLLLLRTGAELTATVLVAAVALSTWGFHPWVAILVVVVMLVVCYVVIGVLPRTLGRQHPYPVGLAAAGTTRALARVLSPIASLLILIGNAITPGRGFREGPFSSDIELRELIDTAGDRGVVEETEREMLQSVFDLSDTIVREVMVPRTEVVWIEETKTLRQAMHLATRSGLSRIPVIGEDVDDVLGVVYIKDLIARAIGSEAGDRGPMLGELMRPPVFVPESKPVDALLRDMQRDRSHFAIVVDEYGGTAGIVTIEDILEEIVGEITDEYDAETPAPIERIGRRRGAGFRPIAGRGPRRDLRRRAAGRGRGDRRRADGAGARPGAAGRVRGRHQRARTGRRGGCRSPRTPPGPNDPGASISGTAARRREFGRGRRPRHRPGWGRRGPRTGGRPVTTPTEPGTPLDAEDAKLVTLARGARARAGAAEGAAVRDTDGRTYAGATVALPSLQLTALQVAVATAVSAAAAALEAAVIVGAGVAPDPDSAGAAHDLSCPVVITTAADGTVTGRHRL